MSRRLTPVLVALASLAAAAAPASAAPAGATFLTGGLELPAGAIAGSHSVGGLSVSKDGRYVAFVSEADTLDPAAHPDFANVFRKDRLTGEVVLVSRADGASGAAPLADSIDPVVSSDGSRVAFQTAAKLDPADADGGFFDVYVRDVGSATTILASQGPGGVQTDEVRDSDLSGDGRFVVFDTSTPLLVNEDRNSRFDVYRRDLESSTTALVSVRGFGPATAGNDHSLDPSISDDGVWVAFVSQATNLVGSYVPGVGNQVFVRDMAAGITGLVSAREGTLVDGADGSAHEPVVAGAPASFASGVLADVAVAYTSQAKNLAPGDADAVDSVYLGRLRNDFSALDSRLVSRADGVVGANANSLADRPSISDDGRSVAFSSLASNLPGRPSGDFYVRDVVLDRTTLASSGTDFGEGALSGDGGFLAWAERGGVTADSDPDLGGIFGRAHRAPAALGTPELVSRPPGSAPLLASAFELEEATSTRRAFSADGRYLAFASASARLPGGRRHGPLQVYRRDLATGAIELVSRSPSGAPGDAPSSSPSISADGTRVAFESDSANFAGPLGARQVFVRDLGAGTTTLVSRADGAAGPPANQRADVAQLSPDGGFVAFVSFSTNLGTPVAGGRQHAYLRDVAGGRTTLVDRATDVAGTPGAVGDGDVSFDVSVSAQGRRVVFSSTARNLHPDDTIDGRSDVYVRDVERRTTTLVSRGSDSQGQPGQHGAGGSLEASISADGRVVAFTSADESLAPEGGGWGGKLQVVARDLASGQNVLVSRAPGGAPADDDAGGPSVSGDGSVVAFESAATNLLPGVGGGRRTGVFARTMATRVLAGPPAFGSVNDGFADVLSISDDGECLAFVARGHNTVTGAAGDLFTSYTHVVSGDCPQPPGPVGPEPPPRAEPRPAQPAISRASLSHKRFRVGRRATAKAAARKRRRAAPVGTAIRFSLNVPASMSFAIERKAVGRKVGRACRKPSARLRRKPRCVRWVAAGTFTRRSVAAGRASLAFSGRIGRTPLRPGSYRLSLAARNEAGASRVVRLPFTVVRR